MIRSPRRVPPGQCRATIPRTVRRRSFPVRPTTVPMPPGRRGATPRRRARRSGSTWSHRPCTGDGTPADERDCRVRVLRSSSTISPTVPSSPRPSNRITPSTVRRAYPPPRTSKESASSDTRRAYGGTYRRRAIPIVPHSYIPPSRRWRRETRPDEGNADDGRRSIRSDPAPRSVPPVDLPRLRRGRDRGTGGGDAPVGRT
mmetsp:Transcript_52077/g.156262  ORF Transcript_52077/g.156262 Transcript_52077/m.156262 type:complete len:201 (-) Transcript_52077:393-995(-)